MKQEVERPGLVSLSGELRPGRGWCSASCQHLLSKVEFPREEEVSQTARHNFKTASAFRVCACRGLKVLTHLQPLDSLARHFKLQDLFPSLKLL